MSTDATHLSPSASPAGRLAALTSWDADWRGLRVVVTGITKTGFSAADTLAELGARVVVVAASDDEDARRNADTLKIVGVAEVLLGQASSTVLPLVDGLAPELVVTSPGLAPGHPLLAAAAEAGIPIWGDVELAWRVRIRAGRRTAEWIAITGTNGKTTTTTMVESMLQAAGLRAIAAGNIGTPILDAVRDPEGYDALAVELSTFQLHWTESMQGAGSALMGIGSARGEDRAVKAAELAIASPLLEASIDGAHGVLLSIQGGSDLGLFEINEAARLVQEVAHPEANIIFGAVIDDALGDEARVTVIAAGFDNVDVTSAPQEPTVKAPAVPAAAPAVAAAAPVATVTSLNQWGQQSSAHVPADGGFDVDLPAIVEPDLSGHRADELDVPDFLK